VICGVRQIPDLPIVTWPPLTLTRWRLVFVPAGPVVSVVRCSVALASRLHEQSEVQPYQHTGRQRSSHRHRRAGAAGFIANQRRIDASIPIAGDQSTEARAAVASTPIAADAVHHLDSTTATDKRGTLTALHHSTVATTASSAFGFLRIRRVVLRLTLAASGVFSNRSCSSGVEQLV
jgi:hypothetical protein